MNSAQGVRVGIADVRGQSRALQHQDGAVLGGLLHHRRDVPYPHSIDGLGQLGGVRRLDPASAAVGDVHAVVQGGEVAAERHVSGLSHQTDPGRLKGAAAGVYLEGVIPKKRQVRGVGARAHARRDDVHDPGCAVGGEPVQVGLVGALQRGPVAQALDRPVAQPVHDYDKDLPSVVHRIDGHYEIKYKKRFRRLRPSVGTTRPREASRIFPSPRRPHRAAAERNSLSSARSTTSRRPSTCVRWEG